MVMWLLGMATQVLAQTPNTSLEPLLRVSDLEQIGLKDVVLASPEAYDRTKELGFVTASDEYPALNFSRFDVSGSGSGTLREALTVFASDLAVVSGVGDEAYSYLGGTFLAFRKGAVAFQLSSGLNVMAGLQPFLNTTQLAQVANVICGRL
jgi:hypothetical protein